MTLRTLLAAAAVALAAPTALAQSTPDAAVARFIELANAGQLTTPEGRALLTGEASEMASDAKSNLPAADRLIPIGKDSAVARIVLRGSKGEEADAYFFLDRTQAGWAVSAYRRMAMSGMTMQMLEEMKKRPTLPPEDQLLKRNLELTLSSDSQLRTWFTANKPAIESLIQTYQRRPVPRTPALDRDPAPSLGPSLKALGLTVIEDAGDGIRVTVGGMMDNTVGFYRAGPSGPPPISPSEFIWVENLGGGWFLFRTT
ncbi:MAG: hypothetical protein Q8R82_13270 [Hyphomonadaceae bacterium]|nr:hypothetical protein [Hyphomonadaceae bacterium]